MNYITGYLYIRFCSLNFILPLLYFSENKTFISGFEKKRHFCFILFQFTLHVDFKLGTVISALS